MSINQSQSICWLHEHFQPFCIRFFGKYLAWQFSTFAFLVNSFSFVLENQTDMYQE